MAKTVSEVSQWLRTNSAPIRSAAVPAWRELVRVELGIAALPALFELLEHGDDEEQYQAMAASRMMDGVTDAEGSPLR